MESGPGLLDPEPRQRHERVADVHEDALVREEDRAEQRHLGQDRHGQARQLRCRAGPRQSFAEDPGEARAEEREGEPGHDLFGAEVDGEHAVEQAQDTTGDHRDHERDPRVARRHDGREPRHRPDQHHSLDAEVQHARSFGEDLADRGEQQDRAGSDAGRQDQLEVHQARLVGRRRGRRLAAFDADPVADQGVAGDEREQDDALDHRRHAGRLDLTPRQGERPEQHGGNDDPERSEVGEVGNDDRRVAIARRDAVLEAVDHAPDLAHPGQAGQGAGDDEHDDDRPLDVDACVARGTRAVADQADLVAGARPVQQEPDERCRKQPEQEPEVDGQAAERRAPRVATSVRRGNQASRGNCSVCWKPPSDHGPNTQYWIQNRAT